jgi:hypothetical protein
MYHGTIIARPATTVRELRQRYGMARADVAGAQKAPMPG